MSDPLELDEIMVTKEGWFANTKEGEPLRPIDHVIYPNRHERRKHQALNRRDLRKGRCDWCA